MDTFSNEQQQIGAYIYSLFAQKDIPRKKVIEKIQKKFPQSHFSQIEEVVEVFTSNNIIDDFRFAENFIRYRKSSMPRGKKMIENELRKHGIDSSNIEKALLENYSDQDEEKSCSFLLQHKWGTYSSDIDIHKKKEKLFRFLLSKGFSFGLISDMYRKMIESEDGF